jgi:alkanesulfonate monooxygenase SsuD/methylene tetrahydromethanopterin reductase-like flavin-dependent oxidoreductase (luciferase family)
MCLIPLETLTFVAANTEKIALGTSVIDMFFHNPVVLGRRFSTLDVFSQGRAIVGLGRLVKRRVSSLQRTL